MVIIVELGQQTFTVDTPGSLSHVYLWVFLLFLRSASSLADLMTPDRHPLLTQPPPQVSQFFDCLVLEPGLILIPHSLFLPRTPLRLPLCKSVITGCPLVQQHNPHYRSAVNHLANSCPHVFSFCKISDFFKMYLFNWQT